MHCLLPLFGTVGQIYPKIVKSCSILNSLLGSFTLRNEPICVNCFSTFHLPFISLSISSSTKPGPSGCSSPCINLTSFASATSVPSAYTWKSISSPCFTEILFVYPKIFISAICLCFH